MQLVVLQLLHERGAVLDSLNMRGRTPLDVARRVGEDAQVAQVRRKVLEERDPPPTRQRYRPKGHHDIH